MLKLCKNDFHCAIFWGRSTNNTSVLKELILTLMKGREFSFKIFVIILLTGIMLYPKNAAMKTDDGGNMKCHNLHIFFKLYYFIAVGLSIF